MCAGPPFYSGLLWCVPPFSRPWKDLRNVTRLGFAFPWVVFPGGIEPPKKNYFPNSPLSGPFVYSHIILPPPTFMYWPIYLLIFFLVAIHKPKSPLFRHVFLLFGITVYLRIFPLEGPLVLFSTWAPSAMKTPYISLPPFCWVSDFIPTFIRPCPRS